MNGKLVRSISFPHIWHYSLSRPDLAVKVEHSAGLCVEHSNNCLSALDASDKGDVPVAEANRPRPLYWLRSRSKDAITSSEALSNTVSDSHDRKHAAYCGVCLNVCRKSSL